MFGKKGRNRKEFQEYLIETEQNVHISHQDYVKSPAVAFLGYCTDAKDSVNYCQKYFPKNKDGDFTKDGLASLQHISSALLPAIMGHFETYQRYLFAGMFEMSHLIHGFDVTKFFKGISKENIETKNLAGYRGFSATAGILLADNLSGWHDPEKVNSYFKSFELKTQIFSTANCKDLSVLWQLRHSIVHTGGSITLPDAQKVDKLYKYGGKVIVFDNNFIPEACRKFHPLIKGATERIFQEFEKNLSTIATDSQKKRLRELCLVKSNSPSLFS
jgi:hypothetical protein